MKAGKIKDIVALLRHDVCVMGRQVHVLTAGCEFDEVIHRLAEEVVCGYPVLNMIKRKRLPREAIERFERAIVEKQVELGKLIHPVVEDQWRTHWHELYVVQGDGSQENSPIKVGDCHDMELLLLGDVVLEGREAYLMTDGESMEQLLRNLADEVGGNGYTRWRDGLGLIPKSELAEYRINTEKAYRELREMIHEVDGGEALKHGGELYGYIHCMQLALSAFGEMVTECGNDMAMAVDRFNECYEAKRFFCNVSDAETFVRVEAMESALRNPICLMGKDGNARSSRGAFVSLALAYLKRTGDRDLRADFFQRTMAVASPEFTLHKLFVYWHYHEYPSLRDGIMNFPSPEQSGLSKEMFEQHRLELWEKTAHWGF